jgi:hypothetical protein
VDAIDTFLRRYPDSPVVLDVLGTRDAGAIRARLSELEPDAEEVFFFGASVGALFGVLRRDGSRVAIKQHKRIGEEAYFDEVQQVQAALADAGFPAPRPLGHRGPVTWEEWLDDGEFRDAHEPDVRRAMARELVRFHRLARETGLRPRNSFLRPAGGLWGKPHNALFDFEATAGGAGWIDEIGAAARVVVDACAGDEVVGHADWSAKHLRFDASLHATALYDWDSVTTDREPALVGNAAGSFTYTEELGREIVMWPTVDESFAFVADYEAERGAPFAVGGRAAAYAACVYLRAYAARCHHAVGGDARDTGLAELAEALL